MQIHSRTQHNTTIWVSDHVLSTFEEKWFDCQQNEQDMATASWKSGRFPVSKFSASGRNLICRHYFRGGVPAHFSRDKFIFRGLENCRSFRELELLHVMMELNLPVPTPIAARCVATGFVYSADIIIEEITNTQTLAQLLTERRLQNSEWQKIGRVIHQFHANDIQHVDLNANNILIDNSGEIFLIDFDRCSRKKYTQLWAKSNLNRLKRSLIKINKANPSLNFIESDFDQLLDGYNH